MLSRIVARSSSLSGGSDQNRHRVVALLEHQDFMLMESDTRREWQRWYGMRWRDIGPSGQIVGLLWMPASTWPSPSSSMRREQASCQICFSLQQDPAGFLPDA